MRLVKHTLAALAAFAVLIASCKKNDDDKDTRTETIKVGALLSMTGNWSTLGITSKAAMEIAAEDINASFSQSGSKYRFTSVVYDTKLDTALALQYIAAAKGAGCIFVVGPQSSAEAGAVKGYAATTNMLVVSQGSTAGSLAIEGDNLFRFCPADPIEGAAIAKTMYSQGIRGLVTAARDDAGNRGLQMSTGMSFADQGGQVAPTTPYSTATSNFSTLLANIKAEILQYDATLNTNQIAVYLASFDECVALFQQAAGDPVLSSVRWYGGDATALSAAITGNATAADFAITTQYFAPSYGLPQSAAANWQPLIDEIKQRTGIVPDAFALAAYDAMWVIANSYKASATEAPGFAKLKSEFPVQAGMYSGATGATTLNAAGDRASGSYDYWGIVKEGSTYKWVVVGKSE